MGSGNMVLLNRLSAAPPFGTILPSAILVPFPPESCRSGLGAFNDWPNSTPDFSLSWYRVVFDSPIEAGPATNLHFGACDWNCTVYLNRQYIGTHIGGYDGFPFDVSKATLGKANELIVLAFDPTEAGSQPLGKQTRTAILAPGGDHYSPTLGIWQTVWLEIAPVGHVSQLKISPSSDWPDAERVCVGRVWSTCGCSRLIAGQRCCNSSWCVWNSDCSDGALASAVAAGLADTLHCSNKSYGSG